MEAAAAGANSDATLVAAASMLEPMVCCVPSRTDLSVAEGRPRLVGLLAGSAVAGVFGAIQLKMLRLERGAKEDWRDKKKANFDLPKKALPL